VEDVVAENPDPIFVTMINPSIEKGLMFFARLAEEIGKRQPKIAVLAIESRATGGMLVEAGRLGGFDLRRHENLMIAGSVPKPRDIFENTRILLVPSVWEEPSGRVAAEALVNGIPPVVSDRGGLAESCNGAGFVLPLPADLTVETRKPVAPGAVSGPPSARKRCSGAIGRISTPLKVATRTHCAINAQRVQGGHSRQRSLSRATRPWRCRGGVLPAMRSRNCANPRSTSPASRGPPVCA